MNVVQGQGPRRITFAESPEKTIQFLRIYADLIKNNRVTDSDIVPLMEAAAHHIESMQSQLSFHKIYHQ